MQLLYRSTAVGSLRAKIAYRVVADEVSESNMHRRDQLFISVSLVAA